MRIHFEASGISGKDVCFVDQNKDGKTNVGLCSAANTAVAIVKVSGCIHLFQPNFIQLSRENNIFQVLTMMNFGYIPPNLHDKNSSV